MAKNTHTKNTGKINRQPGAVNYAYKPHLIGAVIKEIIERKALDPQQVADQMGITLRSLVRWYERKYLFVEQMYDISEVLQENLFLEYHPNVPPPPDPSEEIKKDNVLLKTEVERLTNENGIKQNRITKLEGQKELLDEQVAEFMRRKG